MTLFLFPLAALFEIAGCFAFWAVLKSGTSTLWLAPGIAALVVFAFLLTLVPIAQAGRAYAVYGGITIAPSLAGCSRWRACGPTGGI